MTPSIPNPEYDRDSLFGESWAQLVLPSASMNPMATMWARAKSELENSAAVADLSDKQLVRRFSASEDLEAVQILFGRYESPVFGYLVRLLSNQHDAEDCLQETFSKALQALGRYREQNTFKSWLYRIAHNEAINVIRKRGKAVLSEDPIQLSESADVSDIPSVSDRLIEAEERRSLEVAIQKLPELEREVLLLRLKSDLSFKSIAEVTGCPLNTVLGRMHNAKKRLRRFLEEGER